MEWEPEGVASSPEILETPDHHEPGGGGGRSLLEFCVSEQIARVRYPTGPEVLDVEVSVLWSGPDGLVNVSPRVVAHRDASHRIDLQ